jgi:hypothetical protein
MQITLTHKNVIPTYWVGYMNSFSQCSWSRKIMEDMYDKREDLEPRVGFVYNCRFVKPETDGAKSTLGPWTFYIPVLMLQASIGFDQLGFPIL